MSKTFTVSTDVGGAHSSKDAADYYALNSQQDFQVARTKRISEAMKDPSAYYTKRAAALEAVKTESSKHFGAQYATLVKLNVPHTEVGHYAPPVPTNALRNSRQNRGQVPTYFTASFSCKSSARIP